MSSVLESLKADPLVAVFIVTSHEGKLTIEEDALAKIDAMHQAGIRKFEFLLRGDSTLPLSVHTDFGKSIPGLKPEDTYAGKALTLIRDTLNTKYPDATFLTGTIVNEGMMQEVADSKAVKLTMTAHQPSDGILDICLKNGIEILATSASDPNVRTERKGNGEVVVPPKDKTLVPEFIAHLREKGIDQFKASDFTKIANERARKQGGDWESVAAKDPLTRVTFGLIAVAEAVRDSYKGQVPADKDFCVATTGGVDETTLPYIAAGLKSNEVKRKFAEILGTEETAKLQGIAEHLVLGAGGTFLTGKFFDEIFDKTYGAALAAQGAGATAEAKEQGMKAASKELYLAAREAVRVTNLAMTGRIEKFSLGTIARS